MDEAVFTSNQVSPKVWYPPQTASVLIKKQKIGFKAVAVAAAIDVQGRVVAKHIVDGAIDGDSFMVFLDQMHLHTRGARCKLLVDNLSVHRKPCVKRHAEKLHIELLYNATYSSTYNPIERIWAWSKQRFTKICVAGAPYHNQARMRRIVAEILEQDYSSGLRKHIASCLKNMETWLETERSVFERR